MSATYFLIASARYLLRFISRLKASLANKALQRTGLSVAALPLAPAAERRYVSQSSEVGPGASFGWIAVIPAVILLV